MTTYNAKDLIEQAQMLADLQNSDFISWKENMMFLDNAWADLYQQIINHGDKTFLKSFTMEESRVELPDDFYQLQYICYTNGLNSIPINRKSKTANNNGPYYDIVGNELIIYNRNNCYRTIKVDYFPTRESITFAADDKIIDFPELLELGNRDGTGDRIVDVCDKKVLYYLREDPAQYHYYVIDLATGKSTYAYDSGYQLPNDPFMLAKTGVIYDNERSYFKKDNRAYLIHYLDYVLTIYKAEPGIRGGGPTYKIIRGVHDLPNFPTEQVNAMTDTGFYWVDINNHRLKYWDFDSQTTTDYATNVSDSKVYSFDNNIYYATYEGIWCNKELIISSSDFDYFDGVMKVDMKTGYGILTDNYVIKSVFPTTELDYPNNFYYNFLAYKLAVYYKIKQGADAGGLITTANDALKVFYDTLPKDENEYVRIANVYAR